MAVLTILVLTLFAKATAGIGSAPDFRFPADVSAQAEQDLRRALSKRDGSKALSAMIRIALAETSVTRHSVLDLVQRYDSVVDTGRLSPDYVSLLRLVEAQMIERAPYDALWWGDDVGEQQQVMLESLALQALCPTGRADDRSLFRPLGDYSDVIEIEGDSTMRYIPYLYDFIVLKALPYLAHDEALSDSVRAHWRAVHESDADIMACMFIDSYGESHARHRELYLQYREHPESAFLLLIGSPELEDYAALCDYLVRHPQSAMAKAVTNARYMLERKMASVSYPSLLQSTDSIRARVYINNVPECTLSLYSVPDSIDIERHLKEGVGIRVSDLVLVDSAVIRVDRQIPFAADDTVSFAFPPQAYGRYLILPVFDTPEGRRGPTELSCYDVQNRPLSVSDLRAFGVQHLERDDSYQIIVVDSRTGREVSDAEIRRAAYKNGSRSESFTVTRGRDRYLPTQNIWNNAMINAEPEEVAGLSLFTDLSIYRPGEVIQLSAIAYSTSADRRRLLADTTLTITLSDAKHSQLATHTVITDAFGQATDTFHIPMGLVNGTFRIHAELNGRTHASTTHAVSVSEYKTPTFYVDLSDTKAVQEEDGRAVIRGRVLTYSDVPVAGCRVTGSLNRYSWWTWIAGQYADEDCLFETETDSQGRFVYVCPAEWTMSDTLTHHGWRQFYTYNVTVDCTNQAGESHQGSATFHLGHNRGIELAPIDRVCIQPGRLVHLDVSLQTTDPEDMHTDLPCRYLLVGRNDGRRWEGSFGVLTSDVDWSQVPSGQYDLSVWLADSPSQHTQPVEVALYRLDDRMPPVERPLWIAGSEGKRVSPDLRTAQILIGSSTGCCFYYSVQGRAHHLADGWKEYAPGMHWLEVPMPQGVDEYAEVTMICCHEGELTEQHVRVMSPRCDAVRIGVVSFRNRLEPMSHEHWTLSLTDADRHPVQGRMMLEMYNKALADLRPNSWNLYAGYRSRNVLSTFVDSYRRHTYSPYYYTQYVWQPSPMDMICNVGFNLYGHGFFRNIYRFFKTALYSNAALPDVCERLTDADGIIGGLEDEGMVIAEECSSLAAAAPVPEVAMGSQTLRAIESVPMRDGEVKVALWQPSLTSGDDGVFHIEFDVPNFNTTWSLQALAYSRTLASDVYNAEVLVRRRLMVQPSLPRFVRMGDEVCLKGSVLNSSADSLSVTAVAELFDPRTNVVMQADTVVFVLRGSQTHIVSLRCRVPYSMPYIGYRLRAVSEDGSGDGEQQMLAVLPSSSPVTEAKPFYIHPDCRSAQLEVPLSPVPDSHLTLEYCNNPTWYCLQALPSVIDSTAITSVGLAHNLFAIMVAQLIDSTRSTDAAASVIDRLIAMQHPDGGLVWIDYGRNSGVRSDASFWATVTVMELIGDVLHLGGRFSDERMPAFIERCVQYLDAYEVSDYAGMLARCKKYGGKPSYMHYRQYLYVRHQHSAVPYIDNATRRTIATIRKNTLSELSRQWGTLPFTDKAYSSVLLHREGKSRPARRIIESLRQFAITTPMRGMYWEAIDRDSWTLPVACTSALLNAFAEVDYRREEIDRIRQWMLLEKQTSDWGSSSMAVDAIYSLLNTGTDWLHRDEGAAPMPRILVDGQPLDIVPADSSLGYVRQELPSGTQNVRIERQPSPLQNPAWGALFRQYVQPMRDVRPAGVDELHIEKHIELITASDSAARADGVLHVGDKVRVRLIIRLTKDLEYLTLTDERPSFLEPLDQTSGYRWQGSSSHYLDVKDASTVLYFNRLSEGRHEVEYECYVTNSGLFSVGIATIQSQLAPQFVAHTEGQVIDIR